MNAIAPSIADTLKSMPKAAPKKPVTLEEQKAGDAVAKNLGFVSRNPSGIRTISEKRAGAKEQLNLRVSPEAAERFKAFAKANDLHLADAFAVLMDKAGI